MRQAVIVGVASAGQVRSVKRRALALRLTSVNPAPARTAPVAIPAPSLRTGLVSGGGGSRKQITAG